MKILRRRASSRMRRPISKGGEYDLVLFHAEQSLQLLLKSTLYEKLGSYPKTHSLAKLVKELSKFSGLDKFYKENLEMLNLLEEAYIASRYVPREYDKDLAERALSFVKRARDELARI